MIRVLFLGTALLLLQGCLSGGAGNSGALRTYVTPDGKTQEVLRVYISTAGLVQVGDRVVGLPKMVDAIRATGAKPATRTTRPTGIELVVPPATKADLVLEVTRTLRKAGYARLVFTTGKRREETTVTGHRVGARRKAEIRRGQR